MFLWKFTEMPSLPFVSTLRTAATSPTRPLDLPGLFPPKRFCLGPRRDRRVGLEREAHRDHKECCHHRDNVRCLPRLLYPCDALRRRLRDRAKAAVQYRFGREVSATLAKAAANRSERFGKPHLLAEHVANILGILRVHQFLVACSVRLLRLQRSLRHTRLDRRGHPPGGLPHRRPRCPGQGSIEHARHDPEHRKALSTQGS